jgi:hypothetical protein
MSQHRRTRRPRVARFGALTLVALLIATALGGWQASATSQTVDFDTAGFKTSIFKAGGFDASVFKAGGLKKAKKLAKARFCERRPNHRKCQEAAPATVADPTPSPAPEPAPTTETDSATEPATSEAAPTTETDQSTETDQTTEPATSDPAPTAETDQTTEPEPEPEPTADPTTDPTQDPATTSCTDPKFVTSDPNGMWNDGGYIVHNNMWNIGGYDVSETLSACSYDNWSVTATADNSKGDGAVKTYPNVHKDYHDWSTGEEPLLSSFSTIKSTFAATGPKVGIYNVAYDIWLNGVPGNREIMIWTENHKQVPAGSKVASGVELSGHTWDVYATSSNGYIAFVPHQEMTQGSLDLKVMLDWLTERGRIPADSTLGQICFGVEVVSTDGKPATWEVTDFSITDS